MIFKLIQCIIFICDPLSIKINESVTEMCLIQQATKNNRLWMLKEHMFVLFQAHLISTNNQIPSQQFDITI
jgi:hypothetical protein